MAARILALVFLVLNGDMFYNSSNILNVLTIRMLISFTGLYAAALHLHELYSGLCC